jgi:putative ABC transport system permease protein
LAVVVLISTTLLVRSFVVSVMRSPGFNPKNVVVAQLSLPKTRYAEEAQKRNFADKILGFLHAMPQVTSTGAASAVPFGGFGQTAAIEAVDRPSPRPGEAVGARFTAVSPGYFSAMQMAVIEGRTIAANDAPGEVPSIVINQTLAKFLWPNEDPIGKKMRFGGARTVGTIVGVVNDIKMFQLRSRPERQMYVSLAQFPSATLGIVVRTAGPSSEIAAAVRDAIWDVDNNQPISAVEQLDTLIVIQDTANRVLTKIMVFFGALATLLGAIGIYGLISHLVSQRTHEIGIRVALGASPRQLWGMVIGHGLKLAVGGVAIGVAVAFGVTRFLGFMLYGIAPNDPVTFTSVAAFFAVVAVAACWIPARRAMRVDPMVALRNE